MHTCINMPLRPLILARSHHTHVPYDSTPGGGEVVLDSVKTRGEAVSAIVVVTMVMMSVMVLVVLLLVELTESPTSRNITRCVPTKSQSGCRRK